MRFISDSIHTKAVKSESLNNNNETTNVASKVI